MCCRSRCPIADAEGTDPAVRSYVKRHKNDATDAEAICEAVTRPNMRFVATRLPALENLLSFCTGCGSTAPNSNGQRRPPINLRSSRVQYRSVRPMCSASIRAVHVTAGHNALRGSGPVKSSHSTMLWPLWVVLIAPGVRATNDATRRRAPVQRTVWPSGSTMSPVSIRHWRPPWLPVSRIRRRSGQGGTSRPGSGWSQSRTRAVARTSSAISASDGATIPNSAR